MSNNVLELKMIIEMLEQKITILEKELEYKNKLLNEAMEQIEGNTNG